MAFNHAGVRQVRLDKVKTEHFEVKREYLIGSKKNMPSGQKLMVEQSMEMKTWGNMMGVSKHEILYKSLAIWRESHQPGVK